MEDVLVESFDVQKIKLRQLLIDWENTKSLSVASKICEMLSNNVMLLS